MRGPTPCALAATPAPIPVLTAECCPSIAAAPLAEDEAQVLAGAGDHREQP